MLVINALSASDYVLIPVQAEYFADENMTELVGTVQSIKRQINPKLIIGGVFMTMANDTNFRKTSSGCFTIAMNVLWKLSKQLRKP